MIETADVVVVGGGVIGTAIAYYASRKNLHVHLMEKLHIGSGTSGSSGAIVALQTKSIGNKLELAKESVKLLDDFRQLSEFDIEYKQEGSLVVATTEEEYEFLENRVKALNQSGVRVEILTGDEARNLLPGLSPLIIGASSCPEDSIINPLKLVVAYQKAARDLGAEISLYSEICGIEVKHGAIQAVLTENKRIVTKVVVNAAGIEAAKIAKLVGLKLPIVPRKGEILVTEPARTILRGVLLTANYLKSKALPKASLEDWFSGEVVDDKFLAGIAATQMKRGNLLIGSTREFIGVDRRSTYRGIQALARQITSVLPPVADLHLIRTFAGFRPSTPDGLPIIDRYEKLPGFITAAGHEGDGISLSAITGKLVADLVLGEVDKEKLSSLSLERFFERND